MSFNFVTNMSLNAIIVLDGLAETDLQTGRAIHNYLRDLPFSTIEGMHLQRIEIFSKANLFVELSKIEVEVRLGLRPILHFDMHGDPLAGLQIRDTKEFVLWAELAPYLRKINIASQCNLGVVMAGCFGMHSAYTVSIKQSAPFYFLVGTQSEIPSGLIEPELSEFYKSLLSTGNLSEAIKQVTSYAPLFIERVFAISFGKYLNRQCFGKGRNQRVEYLVTETKWRTARTDRKAIKEFRRMAKINTRPDEEAFNHIAKRFLAGRECSFTFTELVQLSQAR